MKKMDNVLPTGTENYAYLQNILDSEHRQSFEDFLKCYSNQDLLPTLEALEKMIEIYHNKGIDM